MKDRNFLRSLFEYNAWANAETYRKVAELPPEEVVKKRPTPLESIHVSLNHLLNVYHIWLCHMQGRPHGLAGIRQVSYAELGPLREAREAMDRTRLDYVDGQSGKAHV